MLYMALDFFLFNGPLKHELREMFPTAVDEYREALEQGICAKVYNAPIYRGQVERRLNENLWRNGRSIANVQDTELKMLRGLALDELIDEKVLRIKVHANRSDVPVSEEEVDAALTRFKNRFRARNDLDVAMEQQGIASMKELRYRIAAKLQQEKYVLTKIEPALAINDAQAKEWYEEHKESITIAEQRHVRHIFMATLDREPSAVEEKIKLHFESLRSGRVEFAALAENLSEDLRSKNKGGDLGWMGKERVLEDFSQAVFEMTVGESQLVETRLGWHIVEVMAIKEPELLSYESMKQDIITSLRDSRRRAAVAQYRHQLRLLNYQKIDIYREILHAELPSE